MLSWLFASSVGLLLLGFLLGPWVVLRLPSDYFSDHAPESRSPKTAGVRLLFVVMRNLLGVLLIAAGVLMLVLPGQGVLTILAGLLVMKFPAKRRLFRHLYRRPEVSRGLNWLRRRFGREPFHP